MSESRYHVTRDSEKQLERDRRFEAGLLWKGVVMVLVIVLLAWLRQVYWL